MDAKKLIKNGANPQTVEIHTGANIRMRAKELMEKISVGDLKERTKIHAKHARQSREAWDVMLKKLPSHQQAAFACALAEAMENFMYTHYNAIRLLK